MRYRVTRPFVKVQAGCKFMHFHSGSAVKSKTGLVIFINIHIVNSWRLNPNEIPSFSAFRQGSSCLSMNVHSGSAMKSENRVVIFIIINIHIVNMWCLITYYVFHSTATHKLTQQFSVWVLSGTFLRIRHLNSYTARHVLYISTFHLFL